MTTTTSSLTILDACAITDAACAWVKACAAFTDWNQASPSCRSEELRTELDKVAAAQVAFLALVDELTNRP